MDPNVSRRGWFRGVFAAVLAWGARPTAGGPGASSDSVRPRTTHWYGHTTTYTYDAAGSLTWVAPLGSVTTFTYDETGRLFG